MQYRFCFEAVDYMLQDIQNNNRLFGGLPVIIGGYFAQILPLVCWDTRATIVRAWFSLLFLQQNMRLFHNEFGTWL